jgi:multidrug efflux pump
VSREREFSLRTRAGLESAADFEALVIRRDEDGRPVRLGDVADVAVAATGQRWSARVDGRPALSLGLEPTAEANPLTVSRAVRDRLAAIAPTLPEGVVAAIDYDEAGFVHDAIRQVLGALAWALVLVVAVIYLFLGDLRATLVPAVTIPICLVASFAALAWFGYVAKIPNELLLIIAAVFIAMPLARPVLSRLWPTRKRAPEPSVVLPPAPDDA